MIKISSTTRSLFAFSFVLLLVVVSLAAQDAVAQRRRPTGYDCSKVDDAALTTSVSAKIAATHSLNGQNINAAAKSGVVTLTGNVSSAAMKNLAASTASGVKCVKRVVNRLAITPTIPHSDFVCCCAGVCVISSKPCPPCDAVNDCIEKYKAAVAAAGGNQAALHAARQALYACICK